MASSKGLTAERIEAIKKQPIVYDDIPEFTEEQLSQFKPAHPEHYTKARVSQWKNLPVMRSCITGR